MTCKTCNTPNNEGARFCSSCGGELVQSTVSPQSINAGGARAAAGVAPAYAPVDDEVTQVRTAVSKSEAATVEATSPSSGESAHQNIPSEPVLGRTIEGKYRVDSRLGVGGMGAVYRAQRLMIGDDVAIKILHPQHVSEPGATERFRREAQAAARLKHPNAVSIYDFGVTSDGLVYLVMELVEGQSLREVIKQNGPLTPSAAAAVIKQVCAALDEAHRHQIVHRDLKPDNIVVKPMLNGLRVKVLDFGIAILRDLTAGNLTQSDHVMGTPRYMSPEQCLGEEIDSRSDIYSLGIVLYEMLVGVVPFNAPTPTAIVVQQVNQAPPFLRGANLGISAAVESAVMHALAKRREDRPQSARALAAEFSAAVDRSITPERPALPTDAGPPTEVWKRPPVIPAPSPSPQPKNSPYLIPLISVGVVLMLAVVVIGVLLLSRTNPANVSSPSAQNGNAADNRTVGQSSPTPARSVSSSPENIPSPAPRVVQSSPPSNPGLDYSFRRDYQGTIAGHGLLFTLVKTGSTVDGRAETTGANGSWDQLHGPIDPNGSFTLWGRDHGGEVTGKYTGQLLPNGTVQNGFYESIKTGKRIPFYLR